MRQFGFVLVAMLMVAQAHAVKTTAEGGGWNEPGSWNGGVPPSAGESAEILGSAVMTVPSGTTVTNVFVYLYRDASGGAELELMPGSGMLNCRVRLGVTSGTPAENAVSRITVNDGATFIKEAGSGDGKGTEFTTYPGNEFIQKGGLVWSTVNEAFSSQALYDQQGGTNYNDIIQVAAATYDPTTFTTYRLRRGGYLDSKSFMVGAGTAIIEGGSDWSKEGNHVTSFYAGALDGSNGRILFSGVTNSISSVLYVGGHSSQVRIGATGTVDFVDSQLTITKAPSIAASGNPSRGIVRLDNSRVWCQNGINLVNDTAGSDGCGRTAYLAVTNGSILAALPAAVTDPFTVSDSDLYGQTLASVSFIPYPGSETLVENGTIRVGDRLFWGGGIIRVRDGGKISTKRMYRYAGNNTAENTLPNAIYLEGGEFYVHQGDFNLGAPYSASQAPYVGDSLFRMTGGKLTLPAWFIKLGNSSGKAVSRLEVAGGTLDPATVLFYTAPGTAEVSFQGSKYVADISGINFTASAFTKDDALVEFVLDRSPEHIRAVNMSGVSNGGTYTPRLFGNLRVKLDGGVMMTAKDEFALFTTAHNNSTFNAFGGKSDYLTKPDTNLWETILSANARTSSVKLVSATFAAADWEKGEHALAEPLPMGSFALSGVKTDNLKEYQVGLALKAADGGAIAAEKLAELKDGLVVAGYTNSVCDAAATYNLTVAVPADSVSAGAQRFVWDFTETKGIRTVDSVTTNALVSAVKVFAKPLHPGLMIILR